MSKLLEWPVNRKLRNLSAENKNVSTTGKYVRSLDLTKPVFQPKPRMPKSQPAQSFDLCLNFLISLSVDQQENGPFAKAKEECLGRTLSKTSKQHTTTSKPNALSGAITSRCKYPRQRYRQNMDFGFQI
jgi:hypothetical protein